MMSERNVGGRRQGFDRPPQEMHTVTCTDCGEEWQVQFKQMALDLFTVRNVNRNNGRKDFSRECGGK